MLEGITVLDFTTLLPGPHASSRLRDLGATVWKIEPPGGDPARRIGPMKNGTGVVFQVHVVGKTLREVDLTSSAGQAFVHEMAVAADVVLTGLRPGVADRLGIGYDTLATVNPRLIYCSLTGYGQTGPLAKQAGHDLNYQAVSGLLFLTAHTSGVPVVPAVQWADLVGGEAAVTAILAALVDRGRFGRGAFLDISMADALKHLLTLYTAVWRLTGEPHGIPELTGRVVCYRLYRTQDSRWMALGALEPKFWETFCHAVGHPEWIPFQYSDATPDNPVYRAIVASFAARTFDEWCATAQRTDACLTPVLSVPEAAGLCYPQGRREHD